MSFLPGLRGNFGPPFFFNKNGPVRSEFSYSSTRSTDYRSAECGLPVDYSTWNWLHSSIIVRDLQLSQYDTVVRARVIYVLRSFRRECTRSFLHVYDLTLIRFREIGFVFCAYPTPDHDCVAHISAMDIVSKYHQYALQAAAAYKSYTMTEEDTQECAEFLLALKHRSVTSNPHQQVEPEHCTIPVIRRQPRFIAPPHFKNIGQQAYDSEDSPPSRSPALLKERGAVDAFWETLLDGSPLVVMSDRDLVPDPLFVAMSQMKPCTLSEADRVGCYKSRPVAFAGMCCKHCGGQPGFGKYFPETVRSLAQTTTSQTILKHIGSKCRFCPPHVRQALLELQRQQIIKESSSAGRPRYGSRKVFFQRIWSRLHGKNSTGSTFEDNTPDQTPEHSDVDDDAHSAGSHEQQHAPVVPSRLAGRFGVLPTKKNLLKRKMLGKPSTSLYGYQSPSKRSRSEWGN